MLRRSHNLPSVHQISLGQPSTAPSLGRMIAQPKIPPHHPLQSTLKMPSLTSTYLVPAILLNPPFILHMFNTFVSHLTPPPLTLSRSPHPIMESFGPLPGSTPRFDVHADDQLCWRYTAIMVVVQLLAFGRVQGNRVRRKSAKAAKVERERLRNESLDILKEERIHSLSKADGHVIGVDLTGQPLQRVTAATDRGLAAGLETMPDESSNET